MFGNKKIYFGAPSSPSHSLPYFLWCSSFIPITSFAHSGAFSFILDRDAMMILSSPLSHNHRRSLARIGQAFAVFIEEHSGFGRD